MKAFIAWGLLIIAAWSVLNFGAVAPGGYSVMELGVFLLVALLAIGRTWRGDGEPEFRMLWGILPLLVWVCLSLVSMPPHLVGWLSPMRLHSMSASEPAGTSSHGIPITISAHDTELGLARLLSYVGAFVLAAFAMRRPSGRKILVSGLILLGVFEAGFGIFQDLAGYQKIFSYTRHFFTSDATGTYINRNHFAGLLEMIIPLCVGEVYDTYRRKIRAGALRRSGEGSLTSGQLGARGAFFSFVGVLMLIGVLFSHSRMGVISVVFTLIFMGLLGQVRLRQKAWTAITLLILAGAVGYAAWAGLNPLLERFEAFRESGRFTAEGRIDLWRSTLQGVSDYPVTGTGLGTFELAFRHYQATLVTGVADHAHNDYLETALELGWAGFVLLWVPILWVWSKMILAFLADWGRGQRGILFACVGSVLALLVHSAADFNLQIPANALIFSVVAGIGWAASRRSASPPSQFPSSERRL